MFILNGMVMTEVKKTNFVKVGIVFIWQLTSNLGKFLPNLITHSFALMMDTIANIFAFFVGKFNIVKTI